MDDQPKIYWKPLILAIGVVVVILFPYYFFVSTPRDFPQHSVVSILPGETLTDIVQQLKSDHLIRSSTGFQSLVIIFGGEKKVIAGDYLFENKQNAATLAWRLIHGNFGMVEAKVTIPEGFSVSDIGNLLKEKLIQFDEVNFLAEAKNKEGYLFPDTYFFPPTATSSQIISRMQTNFNLKIKPFEPAIATSTHSEYDILKMASILEGEATSTHDRQIVAGILWSRIQQGIPLQVDSSLKYINGKTSEQLTVNDLKINSLYNTYKYKGLPPTPIDNPGTDAISAALNPIKTKYLYFLTGRDGVTHYASTLAEHDKNIEKYLR